MHDTTYRLSDGTPPPRVARNHVSLLFSWGEAVRALALREGQSVIVGRSEPATFIIDDRSLSRTHARIGLRDGAVTLEDLASTNGCAINGTSVRQAVVHETDVAQLGAVELRVAAHGEPTGHTEAWLPYAEFMGHVAGELQRARVFGRTLSVAALRMSEHETKGDAIQAAVRAVDRVCLFAPSLFLVLFVESDAHAAGAWIEGMRGGSKQPWTGGVASYPALSCAAEELVSRALDAVHAAKRGTTVHAVSASTESSEEPIIVSAAMRHLYELVARAARTTLPVLVLGETGSGKELVARALHERSPRAKAVFKAVNCATIPVNLIESILFGHERGAFTGAEKQTQGIFEQAHGGTVFLDEVGELSAQAQAALLRVLEQRRIVRVGGTREIDVDVRVVAATHRDLAAKAAAGSFREDLMFRLDALSLRVPPLRARREEIAPLAELFLRCARERWGATARRFSEDVMEVLLVYSWPGNVRQLKNVVERAAAVCAKEEVEVDDLPEHICCDAPVQTVDLNGQIRERTQSLPTLVREFEIDLIRKAMTAARGNQAQAARILGVPRRTLANKVHAYGLLEPFESSLVEGV